MNKKTTKKKVSTPNPLAGTNGQLMVVAAHRYCLGRQSYIVPTCIEWMLLWWDMIEENTRAVIVRDTVEALQDEIAGSRYDASRWQEFAKWAYGGLSQAKQAWVRDAVGYRGKDWPL